MATLTNNLYPPLIADTQVPFIRTSNYKIYFTLSQYNNAADIKNVQISLINQRTNMSVLNPTKYPSGIKLAPLQYDANKEGDYKYYIEIIVENSSENNDLISDYFDINQYYIIQLRFTSVAASDPPLTGGLDTWLYEEQNNFSEWSNISLLKGINQPIIFINELSQNETNLLQHQLTRISGEMVFSFGGLLFINWTNGTLSANDSFYYSETRLGIEEYINISNFSNITFNPINNYKYYVYFYDSNKNFLRQLSLTSWKHLKKTIDLNNNDIYYMRIGISKDDNSIINIEDASNFSVTYTKLLNNNSVLNNSLEAEYLKNYNIKIYENNVNTNNLIYKSDQIYTNRFGIINEINYEIPYDFDENINYILTLTYKTNNLFTETLVYNFIVTEKIVNNFSLIELSTTPEPENGRIKFDIDFANWNNLERDYSEWINLAINSETSQENQEEWLNFINQINSNKNLIIKRTSSKSNFKIWETLKIIPHNQKILRNVWYDTSIESGIWYKYRVEEQSDEQFYRIEQIADPVCCVFEDMFLTNQDRQLKIQFNPTIGDLKYNVMDSQQTTLGSQYPYIKRNGNMYFRSFSIGGLISAFSDNKDWYYIFYDDNKFKKENNRLSFTSPFEIYGDAYKYYKEYNSQNNINDYQDYLYEREFRKKVSKFLYENNIKLFRSLTEGNILIRLQNIAFQPVNELGRKLYSFTATATEIDNLSITNYNKYNLVNKYYYSYKIDTIIKNSNNNLFSSGESIIKDIELINNSNSEILNIFRLDIQVNQNQNAIFYIKTLNDSNFVRYETQQSYLRLEFDDNQSIEDCYFLGIHLDENQYTIVNQYYNNLNEIQNPINNKVYYIYSDQQNENQNIFKIDKYISYSNKKRLLKTEEKQLLLDTFHDYSLLVDNDIYIKYIYYNNKWYPFSNDGDVLMGTKAAITYYYETKEMN